MHAFYFFLHECLSDTRSVEVYRPNLHRMWRTHLNEFRVCHPDMSLKQCMQNASLTYENNHGREHKHRHDAHGNEKGKGNGNVRGDTTLKVGDRPYRSLGGVNKRRKHELAACCNQELNEYPTKGCPEHCGSKEKRTMQYLEHLHMVLGCKIKDHILLEDMVVAKKAFGDTFMNYIMNVHAVLVEGHRDGRVKRNTRKVENKFNSCLVKLSNKYDVKFKRMQSLFLHHVISEDEWSMFCRMHEINELVL
jgi:hypothetical protein